MNKDLIGIWSGIIWRTLNERGKLSVQELKQVTGLEFEAIYAAVGCAVARIHRRKAVGQGG